MGKNAPQPPSSAMEIDADPNPKSSDQLLNKFSINVLQLLKSAQMQHGLRHGDYTRYRRYCTARLRRLYKSEVHSWSWEIQQTRNNRSYSDRPERAWSHAMEKRQLPDGPSARQHIYLIGRLRKAVKWATPFSNLCSIKGDSRTSLEAEAYASYMKGNLLFEQDKNWDTALAKFKSARAVYEELGKYGDLENQVLCRERVEELEPSIRYCMHKIGQSNLNTSELLQIGEVEGPALDLFKAKLEAVMAEARSQQAASMTEFHWLGHRFPISNPKTRVSILKAQELEKDLHGPSSDSLSSDKKLAVFDKIFSAYHEARSCIRSDLVTAGNAENVKDELNGLDKAVSAVLGQRTMERNQLLIAVAKGKTTKPEELVRLYDLLLQNSSDLSDLVSSGRDQKPEEVALAEECEVKSLAFRAERCFFLAKSFSLAGKRVEAYALYCRARTLAEGALQKFQALGITDKHILLASACEAPAPLEPAIKELRTLHEKCRSQSCIEHATGILEEEQAPEHLSHKISNISLNEDKKLEKYLMEKLDSYESAVGDSNTKGSARIQPFPPPFQSIPRNPIVLDLADSYMEFPSLESRMKKEKKGLTPDRLAMGP